MNTLSTLKSWLHPATPSRPAATTPAERQKTLDDIALERRCFEAACARDVQNLAAAAADEREAETRLVAAKHRHAEIATAQLSASLAHGVRISNLTAHLIAGAPECIDRFIADLNAEAEETRRRFEALGSGDRERNEITGELSAPMIATNAASVRSRLDAIYAAVARAQALKLDEVDVNEDTIKATLRQLLAGLPAVEGALRETGPLFTPAEVRHAEWRRQGATR